MSKTPAGYINGRWGYLFKIVLVLIPLLAAFDAWVALAAIDNAKEITKIKTSCSEEFLRILKDDLQGIKIDIACIKERLPEKFIERFTKLEQHLEDAK